MMNDTQRVKKIQHGTVIDHIAQGKALAVLRILGIRVGHGEATISIAMNVESNVLGKKDIVKIENRELTQKELNQIALIAPDATINIIRDFTVVKKTRVKIPKIIPGVVPCSNPRCITNSGEPVSPIFDVMQQHPIILRCQFCKRYTQETDILNFFSEST
ncbi:MAG: aspartate carbamoyltransferase regulatory subunit [Candidatus Ranarchaeia archaeon]